MLPHPQSPKKCNGAVLVLHSPESYPCNRGNSLTQIIHLICHVQHRTAWTILLEFAACIWLEISCGQYVLSVLLTITTCHLQDYSHPIERICNTSWKSIQAKLSICYALHPTLRKFNNSHNLIFQKYDNGLPFKPGPTVVFFPSYTLYHFFWERLKQHIPCPKEPCLTLLFPSLKT